MNEERALLRVAIRADVIPMLEAATGRNVRESLARSAALLARDARFLDRLAAEAEPGVVGPARDGSVQLRARALRELAEPLATRIVRQVLLRLGKVPEAAHVEAVIRLADARPGARVSLGEGLLAERGREYVRVVRPSPGRPPADHPAART